MAFYDGKLNSHLDGGTADVAENLPWRSFAATSQLEAFVAAGRLPPKCRCLELGCGHGENTVLLAQNSAFAVGVDIAPASVEATNEALKVAGLADRAQALQADILDLPQVVPALMDGKPWEFDFVFDCQCFHCLRMIPGLEPSALADVYSGLLKPGGRLLLLTGSSEEPTYRGPERLSRCEVFAAFGGKLVCEELTSTQFDWTPTYRKQGLPDPPLGWLSVWVKPGPSS